MTVIKPRPLKCSPDECLEVARRASGIHPVLSDAKIIAKRARLFRALGNETRLKILGLLSVHELCICDIAAALEAAGSTLAHHLWMLHEAELISARQEGKFTFYSLNADALKRHRVLDGTKPVARKGDSDAVHLGIGREPAVQGRPRTGSRWQSRFTP